MSTKRKSHQTQRSRKVLRNASERSEANTEPRQPAAGPSPTTTGDKPVWGAKAIGAEINRSERQAYHLLESGAVKGAKKVNGMWSAIPSVLRAQWESR